ncbi:ABC-type uncharacterized transport system substrate-binding protein [Janthinobacterium sp. CG_23.3]|uniref:hypothetical protein n=1 Tax=unclassified Janthinobacterium TaxID=2610881 RepID=UPI00034609E1|nr:MULTISPECIES: hypothetical protein [unclassified Janthinobacterium]MEC5161640.1 ABC-type uncharacterized transport system substrate-binding protein [Janthinobacterium sp. CG_S6]
MPIRLRRLYKSAARGAAALGGIVLALAPLCGGAAGAAAPHNHAVHIAVSDDSESTRGIVAALSKAMPAAQVSTDAGKRQAKSGAIYIAVGPAALRALLQQNVDGVIIAVYTSGLAYRGILDAAPGPRAAAVTAIYAEPSPALQLRLITLLYKQAVTVAVILSDKTSYLEPLLQRAAVQAGSTLRIEHFAAGSKLNRVLNRIADVPTLLVMPDGALYNPENIRNILMTSYRHNQSVIGFSAGLVKAGALASIYSDNDDIHAQIEELIGEVDGTGKVPEPQYAKYYSVIVNDDVAESLNLVVNEKARRLSRKPPARQP